MIEIIILFIFLVIVAEGIAQNPLTIGDLKALGLSFLFMICLVYLAYRVVNKERDEEC